MRTPSIFFVLLAIGLLTSDFQCVKDCRDDQPIMVAASNKVVAHLDNRGATPLVLEPGMDAWRTAYGFRLSATVDLQNQADTLGVDCPYYYLSPSITGLSIITLTGMGPDYPPGAEVSSLFKFVKSESSQYLDIALASGYLTYKWSFIGAYSCDFLLVQTPAIPGWHQFDLQFQQSDTTTFSIVTDSIYLQ